MHGVTVCNYLTLCDELGLQGACKYRGKTTTIGKKPGIKVVLCDYEVGK